MKLIYCYIEEYRNIIETGFNLSSDYQCCFDSKKAKLMVRYNPLSDAEQLVSHNSLTSLTVIVGKNGSGKTNLLQLLGMSSEARRIALKNVKYFLLYVEEAGRNVFIIETNRILPKGLHLNPPVKFWPATIRFKYGTNKIWPAKILEDEELQNTVVINSFEKDALNDNFLSITHIDGVFESRDLFQRIVMPYGNANAGVACWYAKQYISSFSDDCIKRDAELFISSRNWSRRLQTELNEDLMKEEYWFYHSDVEDHEPYDDRDVKEATAPNIRQLGTTTQKEAFIHDLLTDYALYLRKIAEARRPLSKAQAKMRRTLERFEYMGVSDVTILPDGQCVDDLSKRIDWLAQYLDFIVDEVHGNHGMLHQISDDIIDFADIFRQFDEECFSDGHFSYPIEDIDFDSKRFQKLFEIMSRFRADQAGIFQKELLPFRITYLSSGEYQYARVLGVISELTAKGFLHTRQHGMVENIVLLLDEPETFMHPEMCRNFIYWMGRVFKEMNRVKNIQVIMTTHSPFMLSDLLPQQIIRLQADEDGYCNICEDVHRPTFAGDIHSIMAHEFFLDYTIGENSRRIVTDIAHSIRDIEENINLEEQSRNQLNVYRQVLSLIGDDMIRETLRYMLDTILVDR